MTVRRRVRRDRTDRRGMVIVISLVCISVAAMIALALTTRLVNGGRFQRRTAGEIQAEMLLDSLEERTLSRLLVEPDFIGEEIAWAPEESGLDRPVAASIRIVDANDVDANDTAQPSGAGVAVRIHIEVEYGVETSNRVRRTLVTKRRVIGRSEP
jgi:hypothetical protein